MIRRPLRPAAALLALVLLLAAFAAPAALAQERRPLLMDGMRTLYQRVLTRPGAPLHDLPGGRQTAALPAFQPLYVFSRREGWLEVGPSPRRPPQGWVEAARVVEWKQNIVAAFTNPADRARSLIFRSPERLRWLMENEALADIQAALIERADGGTLTPDDGVVSIEPASFVNIRDNFYVMPILGYLREPHPLSFEDNLLLRVASVPLPREGAAPAPAAAAAQGARPAGQDFDAGVVFVLDTTRSMGPYIARTREALARIVEGIEGTDIGERINFGAIGFRDSPEAVPGLEYRTRVLVPLERRRDQAPVLEALAEATRVAPASSPGFNEDSMAGVEDAIDAIDWDQAGGDAFDGRYVILVTDAGPNAPDDPLSRSAIGPVELQRDAEGRNIVILTLHLKTRAGEGTHEYAAEQYRRLSRFGGQSFYYPIADGSEDEFARTVTLLVTALTDHIRAARGEAAVLAEGAAGPGMDALGRAMRLAWLGTRDGTAAPDVIEGWVSARAPENPARMAIEPRLLVTKNELATMAELIDGILRAAEATRDEADAAGFFGQVRGVLAGMAANPDTVVDPDPATLGGALEYLAELPYRSQILQIDEAYWSQSAMVRRAIMDGMGQKLVLYRKWLYDDSVWTALDPGAPDGERVFAMPLDMLP